MVIQLSIDRYHYVLVLIDFHDENLSQKALAEILHIDKSYMVNILDYLEEKGYVLREKNPYDRREQLIRLTAKAQKDIPIITISQYGVMRSFNVAMASSIVMYEYTRQWRKLILNVIRHLRLFSLQLLKIPFTMSMKAPEPYTLKKMK